MKNKLLKPLSAFLLCCLAFGNSFAQTDITNSEGTISAQYTDSPSGEGIDNVVDNNSSTKYLTLNSSGWIQWDALSSYVLSSYSITSANDAAERDPASWVLWGYNTEWVLLDSRNDEDFPNRFQERSFSVSNNGSYNRFHIQLTNNSGSILQLAEFKLFSAQGGGNGCVPSPITPYLNVNGNGWIQSNSTTVDRGANIQFGPQPAEGSWSWSGPSGYSSSVREAVINNISTSGQGTYTATHTNSCGTQTTQNFQISVNGGNGCNPDPITPYVKNSKTGWSNGTAFYISIGDNIGFGPHPVAGGSWSWSGPNGFSSSSREISLTISNRSQGGTYTATFTNSCGAQSSQSWELSFRPTVASWDDFIFPTITYEDEVPGTAGSDIFNTVFPNVIQSVREIMLEVLQVLYDDVNGPMRSFNSLTIVLKNDPNLVASASGNSLDKTLNIGYSFVQDIYNNNGQSYDAVRRELEGVMVHESTHLYQWEPKNAGDYDGSSVFWAFIEGEGDGVRALLRNWVPTRFPSPGGNWNDGYERTGFFLAWCQNTKSSTFFIDINRYALEAPTFTWNGAFQATLGQNIQDVWNEYQNSLNTRTAAEKSDVTDINALPEMSLYPNPVSDILNINLEGEVKNTVADIYSIAGSKVLTQYLSGNSSRINVSALPKGAYLVVIRHNGKTIKEKIIK